MTHWMEVILETDFINISLDLLLLQEKNEMEYTEEEKKEIGKLERLVYKTLEVWREYSAYNDPCYSQQEVRKHIDWLMDYFGRLLHAKKNGEI